ncbi:hypothetical protein DAMA08_025290 [Martiniozyma asiatica (nom. inval.)]|nr:hypothetical protein DAMA08_025290 [Martiniozyma asiatica]
MVIQSTFKLIGSLPLELQQLIITESLKSCRVIDVLEYILECGEGHFDLFGNLYEWVLEKDRIYFKLYDSSLAYVDINQEKEWGKLVKELCHLSKISIIVKDANHKALPTLLTHCEKIHWHCNDSNDLVPFIKQLRKLHLEHLVDKIEINDKVLQNNFNFIVGILNGHWINHLKLIKINIDNSNFLDVINQIENSLKVKYLPSPPPEGNGSRVLSNVKLIFATTYSLNPQTDADLKLMKKIKELNSKNSINLKILFNVTVSSIAVLCDFWDFIDVTSIYKLIIQNSTGSMLDSYCLNNKDIHRLKNCKVMIIYAGKISKDWLSSCIPRSVQKLSLIYLQYISNGYIKNGYSYYGSFDSLVNLNTHKNVGSWEVPSHLNEINLFCRSKVPNLEYLLANTDWSNSDVRGFSFQYYTDFTMGNVIDAIHVSIPATLEQFDLMNYSSKVELLCDRIPKSLIGKKVLFGGKCQGGERLQDRFLNSVELVNTSRRLTPF